MNDMRTLEAQGARQGERMQLDVETPKAVLLNEELQLIEMALAKDPSNRMLRVKQAALLHHLTRLDEAIAVLDGLIGEREEPSLLVRLALVCLALETEDGSGRARNHAARAFEIAETDNERAAALATQGKAEKHLGRIDVAEEVLLKALQFDPHSKDAFKRLAAVKWLKGEDGHLLQLIGQLQQQGVNHSRLLSALAVTCLKTGDIPRARDLFGADAFVRKTVLAPPPGWSTITEFNAAIVEEMSNHPAIHRDRPGAASQKTWRVDYPATKRSRMIPQLQSMIMEVVRDYAEQISGSTHPWVRARPAKAQLHNWCVMTDGDGYEEWHVHQFGWLSGVYYAGVPQSITQGTDNGGCIAFGIPPDLAGEEVQARFGTEVVRPQEGLLMLFPSHCYHRTFPHHTGGRRTCMAFDIQPL